MKTLLPLLLVPLLLSGCKDKDQAGDWAAEASRSGKKGDYPPALQLISDAEMKSSSAESSRLLLKAQESLAGMSLLNEAQRADAESYLAKAQSQYEQDRNAAREAMALVRAYNGNDSEEREIREFLRRDKMRSRIRGIRQQLEEAKAGNDAITVKELHKELAAIEAELAAAEARWIEIWAGGFKDGVKAE